MTPMSAKKAQLAHTITSHQHQYISTASSGRWPNKPRLPCRFPGARLWLQHVQGLLKKRYTHPGTYQKVPDTAKGDCGIEGFATDGTAYQCYAAQHWTGANDLCKKQKSKIEGGYPLSFGLQVSFFPGDRAVSRNY